MNKSIIYLILIFAFWLYCKIVNLNTEKTEKKTIAEKYNNPKYTDGNLKNGEFGVDSLPNMNNRALA